MKESRLAWLVTGIAAAMIFLCGTAMAQSSDALVVDQSGKVGIGTTNPQYKLHVTSPGYTIYGQTSGSNVYAGFFNGATHGLYGLGGQYGIVSNISAGSGGVSFLAYGKYGGFGVYTSGESYNYFSGNVGIGSISSYKLDVIGDIHCTGKLTSDGPNDPPFVLYNFETRESIVSQVVREVPPDKLDGAVVFFNGEISQMEVFLPKKGEFRSVQGELRASVKPITQTFEVEDRYYFDPQTGEIKSYKAKKDPGEKYRLKRGCTLDPKTGRFYQIMTDQNGVETNRVEVTKAEAVEELF
jgi:hypothetical protein